jgi:topoisomerase IV subunit A
MVKTIIPPPKEISAPINLREALEERYLAYALSTITNRALPDARDGLKPVQRRILYGMNLLRLDPTGGFRKCAKIVGDVMGDFHPHGDQAIYETMVRLAQDFAQRYTLVDGQGNFGNIDGDNAAAYRYTEARMTEVAGLLLRGIDEEAVDFRPSYNGEKDEPVVLPGAFPNLLANGTTGIAVGMATSIPPHNAAELCDAALYMITHPEATNDQLLHFVPGPDFPTGGTIVESKVSIAESYRTGRGGFRVRAKWAIEDLGKGNWVVVITEIPYLVRKSNLIEKIADLLAERKLPLVADIRDESAEDVRVVIEPRLKSVDPALMMESLFKLTELESRISLNLNVLIDGVTPRVVSLLDALRAWIDHRRVVLQRRMTYRLGKIDHRLEILGGLLVVYLNLDEVIRIIREEDDAKASLIQRFSITEIQANAILDTRLRSLRKLEEMELRREFDELTKEREQINALLASDELQWKTVAWEIREVRKTFGPETKIGKRRTQFGEVVDIGDFDMTAAMVEREPITVVVSDKGWIRALKGHVTDTSSVQFRGDDTLKQAFTTETTQKLLVLASNGKVFTIEASKLPGGRGFGDPIRLLAEIEESAEIISIWPYQSGIRHLMVGADGRGFVVKSDDLIANTKKGKQVLNVDSNIKAVFASSILSHFDTVAILGENRKLLVFALEQIPEMGRGKGVRLQKYKDGGVADIKTFELEQGLTWTDPAGRTFTVKKPELDEWIGSRADAGRLPPKGFPKKNTFTG